MAPAEQARNWLKQLGVRIAPSMTAEEFAGRIAVMAEDLAETFDGHAFTRETLLAVATKCRFWPNLAEIYEIVAPMVRQSTEDKRLLVEYSGSGQESREPYDPGPAPDWCFDHGTTKARYLNPTPNYLTRAELTEAYRRAGVRGPVIPAEPLRAAAAPIRPEVRRGPPLDDPDA